MVDFSAMNIEIENSILSSTPSAQLLKTPTMKWTLNFDFSSDPLSSCAQISQFSAALSAIKILSRKRKTASITGDIWNSFSNKTQRTIKKSAMVQEAILEARKLLIKAFLLAKAFKEQSKILDLLEIFREYTETEKVLSASHIVATQVASLETTSWKLKARAKKLAISVQKTPSQPQPQSQNKAQNLTLFFTQLVSQETQQEWTQVMKKEQKIQTQSQAKSTTKTS